LGKNGFVRMISQIHFDELIFYSPVIIEVPHFASLRGREREIVILRSDNGEIWREHTLEATEDAVQEVLQESFDSDGKNIHYLFDKISTHTSIFKTEISLLEDLNTNRITRILTTDFPQYFALISRIRQEVHTIGPEGKNCFETKKLFL